MLIRMSMGTATVKTVGRFLSKLKIELTYAAISLLCVYPLKKEMLVWKDVCTPTVTVTLFTITKIEKWLVSISGWKDKGVIHSEQFLGAYFLVCWFSHKLCLVWRLHFLYIFLSYLWPFNFFQYVF